MKRIHSCIAIIVAATAFATVPAEAAPFTSQMEFAFELGVRYWGGIPNCTSLDREIVSNETFTDANELGEATLAQSPTPCFIYIKRELAKPNLFERMCEVEFHEVGHLHGLEHSTDPNSIMYPEIRFITSRCRWAGLWVLNHPRRYRND